MHSEAPDYRLEFLLAFDGRIHHLEAGYWIKFEIVRVKAVKVLDKRGIRTTVVEVEETRRSK